MLNWHALTAQETADYLGSDTNAGLTQSIAEQRLSSHGKNLPRVEARPSFFKRVCAHLLRPVPMIIAAAAVTAAVIAANDELGNWMEPIIILLLMLVICCERAADDMHTERTLDHLKSFSDESCEVTRDSKVVSISAQDIVPGDIILLSAGDIVPADARLLSAFDLSCDESASESRLECAEKSADIITDVTAPVDKRVNMIYAGCPVLSGQCSAIVTATGATASLGRAASLLDDSARSDVAAQRPLGLPGGTLDPEALTAKSGTAATRAIEHVLGSQFANGIRMWHIAALAGVGLFLFAAIVFRRAHDLKAIELIIISLTLAYAAMPYDTGGTVYSSFVRGAAGMSERGIITHELSAIDRLAASSVVICSDSTGVLTTGEVSAERIWAPNEKLIHFDRSAESAPKLTGGSKALLEYLSLCLGRGESRTIHAAAIVDALGGTDELSSLSIKFPRIACFPRSSEHRLTTTVHCLPEGGYISVTCGQPDILLKHCGFCDEDAARAVFEQMSREGLHVIAAAFRRHETLPKDMSSERFERDLTFAGLIGISDILRTDNSVAAEEFRAAGITPIICSDNYKTAATVRAQACDILQKNDEAFPCDGICEMSEAELEGCIRQHMVYAQPDRTDKKRLVDAWHANGETVCITGRSSADCYALDSADVGIYVGRHVSPIVRKKSGMGLSDGWFSSIPIAIRQSRGICDNVRNVVRLLLACSISMLLSMLGSALMCGTTPLLSVHILAAVAMSGMPLALLLSYEPPDASVMLKRPRRRIPCVPLRPTLIISGICGVVIAVVTVSAYVIGKPGNVDAGRTMAFGVMMFSQIFCAVSMRSDRPLYAVNPLANLKLTVGAVLCTLATLCGMLFAHDFFLLVPLTGVQWLWVIGLSLAALVVFELSKFIRPFIRAAFAVPDI